MRQFSSSGFRLWNLGLTARVLYSAFCALTFLGIVSSVLYYGDLVGAGTKGIARYYGGAAPAAPPAEPTGSGPAIDVPADAEAGRPIVVAVSYRKLLEVTHFHLFTMPVVFLIVAHLFLATGLGELAKLAWIVAGIAGITLHLAAPWVVRYGGPSFAFLHAVSGVLLTVTMAMLTLYPLVAMWRPPRAEAAARAR
jgi:hypothetical protein